MLNELFSMTNHSKELESSISRGNNLGLIEVLYLKLVNI